MTIYRYGYSYNDSEIRSRMYSESVIKNVIKSSLKSMKGFKDRYGNKKDFYRADGSLWRDYLYSYTEIYILVTEMSNARVNDWCDI